MQRRELFGSAHGVTVGSASILLGLETVKPQSPTWGLDRFRILPASVTLWGPPQGQMPFHSSLQQIPMTCNQRLLAALSLAALSLPAQNFELSLEGGSVPGPLAINIEGLNPFEFVVLIPSNNNGPTPIGLFDPADLRSLDVGFDMLGSTITTLSGLFGDATVQLQVPPSPAFVDRALFWQAVTFQFLPTLINQISNPDVVRFGTAGAFRDRNLQTFDLRAFATALVRDDNKPLLVGGARGALLAQVATDQTEIYDPVTDLFVPGPVMTSPRSLHTQTEMLDGRFLITGGVDDGNNPQALAEIYDPATDTFTAVTPMNVPRCGATANLLDDGRVLLTGGLEALSTMPTQLSAIRDAVDSTEIYDPVTNTWTMGPSMNEPRAGHMSMQRTDGKIMLCGGISWYPVIFIGWLPTVETSCDIYDPATNTISAGPSMNNARALIEPVEIGPDRWLLAGGMNGLSIIPLNAGSPTNTAEIYDANANTWTSVGSMATARVNQKGWALPNGTFMLAGGGEGSILAPVSLDTTEIFDPATNTFSPGPTMNSPRAAAGMLFMPTGQVFLFGGASTNATVTNTTEWYFF